MRHVIVAWMATILIVGWLDTNGHAQPSSAPESEASDSLDMRDLNQAMRAATSGCGIDSGVDYGCLCGQLQGTELEHDLSNPVVVSFPLPGTLSGSAVGPEGQTVLVPLGPTLRVAIDSDGTISACGVVQTPLPVLEED